MTHDDPLNTPASSRGAPHPRTWLPLTVATFVAIAAAIMLSEGTRPGVDASSQPLRNAIGEVGPLSLIDHSVVESNSLADEPDMTGASVGAYGR